MLGSQILFIQAVINELEMSVREKIKGLDALRAVAALWVFGSHLAVLRIGVGSGIGLPSSVSVLFDQLLGASFCGVAAVMIFFVISGFCIHLATEGSAYIQVGPFLVRRFVRVGLPLIVAVILSRLLFGSIDPLQAVLWTLYCELIYYFLYPWLSCLANRIGWIPILLSSLIGAFLLIALPDTHGGALWAYGPERSWIIGLPVWLCGVLIAHSGFLRLTPLAIRRVMLWLVIWTLSVVALILHAHLGIPYKYTMVPFGIVGAYFVFHELKFAAARPEVKILEWVGVWSYSLYLCHKLVIEFAVNGQWIVANQAVKWSLTLFVGLVISVIFHYLVEKPAHEIARACSRIVPPLLSLKSSWAHKGCGKKVARPGGERDRCGMKRLRNAR